MSQQLISRSPDLKRLRDEGFGIDVKAHKYLVVDPVPYVKQDRTIGSGKLVCELTFSGNDVIKPADHVAHFIGAYPCDAQGKPLAKIFNSSNPRELTTGLTVEHTFSAKPVGEGYRDFYEKVSIYVAMIAGPAQSIDSTSTAQTFPVIETGDEESVFRYVDTASSRSEIDAVTAKLEGQRIAIVGLGGTGSYILDLVAKTPVKEIHVFDGDEFSQHNAFRSPGAPSIASLQTRPRKIPYWCALYSAMHRYVIPHDYYITEANVSELAPMDFVFLCLDRGPIKKVIVECLEQAQRPFVDVGMGIQLGDGSLNGLARVTASTVEKRDHVPARVSFGGDDGHNEYARNIQVADLNALNAALAVIKWKKLRGFYADLEREHFCAYVIDGNNIINEDSPV